MNRKTDLNYIDDGLYVSFFPNTYAGRQAWDEMAKHDPMCRFPSHMLPSIKAQIKAAGMTIRKEPKSKMSLDQIMAELSA